MLYRDKTRAMFLYYKRLSYHKYFRRAIIGYATMNKENIASISSGKSVSGIREGLYNIQDFIKLRGLFLCFKIWIIAFLIVYTAPALSKQKSIESQDTLLQRQIFAEEVFTNVSIAFGSSYPNNLEPKLVFTDKPVIAFYAKPDTIFLENRFLNLCFEKYGYKASNALAVILGHELTHYYEQHKNGDYGYVDRNNEDVAEILNFINKKKSDISNEEENIARNAIRKIMEAQADRKGLFYGYVAGYDTFRYFPFVLEDIYSQYKLSDEDLEWGYFKKTERKQIANNQALKLRELIPIFDAGVYLLISNRFRQSADCFAFLSKKFPSREIFNNAGLSLMLSAYCAMDVTEVPNYSGKRLKLPFLLDIESRLSREADGNINGKRIKSFLDKSERFFLASINRDTNYYPAYINLALLYLLRKEFEKAVKTINKAEAIFIEKEGELKIRLNLVKAAILFCENKFHKSKSVFESYKDFSKIAKYNYSLINGEKSLPKNSSDFFVEEILVSGNNIRDARDFQYDSVMTLEVDSVTVASIYVYKAFSEWSALKFSDYINNEEYYFIRANEDYSFPIISEINIGAEEEAVREILNSIPDFNLPINNGKIEVYQPLGVALKFNRNKILKEFILF